MVEFSSQVFSVGILLVAGWLASPPVEMVEVTPGTLTDYAVDTLVVVDDVMYDSWKSYLSPNLSEPAEISKKIKEYVALVVHQANQRLETIRQHGDMTVKMNLVDMKLNQAVLEFVPANILTRRIRAEIALVVFQNWALKQELSTNYDHLMLLSGRPMEGAFRGIRQSSVKGRAYIGSVCDKNGTSVSVVEDLGGFQSSHVVAHELAHSLGAVHDGEPGAETCSAADRYLMSAVSPQVQDGQSDVIQRNPWFMSHCSVESIRKKLDVLERSSGNCLNTTSAPMSDFSSTSLTPAGQIYDAVQQCRMLHGAQSSLCLGVSFSSVEGICTTMYCARSESSCVQHYAAEGTTCGNKMWCRMGQCVFSQEAPQVGACPYGDTALLRGDGMSCATYIAENPSVCYNAEIRQICCASCQVKHTDSEVCPYGDKRLGCTQDVCTQVYRNGTYLAELCCGTCRYETVRECRDVSTIDGLTCDERTTMFGNQECYNGTVAFYCCKSCSEERIGKSGCEYGDYFRGNYCQSQARYDFSGCRTRRMTTLCCLTCDPEFERKKDIPSDKSSHIALQFSFLLLPFLKLGFHYL